MEYSRIMGVWIGGGHPLVQIGDRLVDTIADTVVAGVRGNLNLLFDHIGAISIVSLDVQSTQSFVHRMDEIAHVFLELTELGRSL